VYSQQRHHCRACGNVTYVNPRLVVTTLPVTDSGEVVLIRRAIEPGAGTWAQPGGFLEADETAIQGAVRETLEETCLVVEPTSIVGLYSRPQASVVVVAYIAQSLYQRLRMFTVWQQSGIVFAIVGLSQLINFWIENIAGLADWSLWYLLPSVVSALLWPWIFLVLRYLRRVFDVT